MDERKDIQRWGPHSYVSDTEGAQGMKVSLNQVMELLAKSELETDLWIQPHGENWQFKKNCFTGKERKDLVKCIKE